MKFTCLSLLLLLSLLPTTVCAKTEARPVRATRVVAEPVVQQLELTGTIRAKRQARLSARTNGLILKLHVDAGSQAKAGDILMELDPVLARITEQRIQAEVAQASAAREEAQRRYEEVRELVKVGGFSKAEADTRETAVRVQAAALERAEAQLAEQKEIIVRHRLVAPFAGVIRVKLAEEGEWVQTGTPVVELVETGHVLLDVQVPQEWSSVLHGDQPVAVTARLDAHAGTEMKARIETLVPVKDPVARTFLLRLALEDPLKLATPGMSARAQLRFGGEGKSLQIPRDALVLSPDGPVRVWVVREGGGGAVVVSRTIKTGLILGSKVVVLEGLEENTSVVLEGNEGLTEGQAVRVMD